MEDTSAAILTENYDDQPVSGFRMDLGTFHFQRHPERCRKNPHQKSRPKHHFFAG